MSPRGSGSLGQYGRVDPATSPRLPPKPSILPDYGGLAGQRSGVPAELQAVAFDRSTAHDGPVSIVIGARLGQHLKSLAELPIDCPAHFCAGRGIGADAQQPRT